MSLVNFCYASAGAGKTQALVTNYLLHALKKPEAIQNILAITFTNAATQEMKSRLLEILNKLVKDEEPHTKIFSEKLALTTKKLQKKAQALLDYIVHHFHALHIYTIDALFQKIVQSFAQELMLPTNYELLLEQNTLLEEVIMQFWATLSQESTLEQALSTLALEKIKKGKSWDCTGELKALSRNLFQPYVPHTTKQKNTIENLDQFFAALAEQADSFRQEITSQATLLLEKIHKKHFTAQDFAWGKNGIIGFLEKTSRRIITKPSSRVRKTACKPLNWIKKTTEKNESLLALVETHLQKGMETLLAFYDAHYKDYVTTEALQALYYVVASMTKLKSITDERLSLEHTVTIAECASLVKKILETFSVPFLYEKIGNQYEILLIDEFQDLSTVQWELLYPLLTEALSKNGAGFLVGDVKQAIYRWRGGDAQLFLTRAEKDIGNHYVKKEFLPYNWRSCPNIIAVNNALYTIIPQLAKETLETFIGDHVTQEENKTSLFAEIAQIEEVYGQVKQALPPKKEREKQLSGYVQIAFLPRKKEQDPFYNWQKNAIQRAIQKVEEIQKNGFPPEKIAILVRDHKEAHWITEAMDQYQKGAECKKGLVYTTTTSKKLNLRANPFIQLLVHSLHYVYRPEETDILPQLVFLYQNYSNKRQTIPQILRKHTYWHAFKHGEALHYLPKNLVAQRLTWARMPLPLLLEKVIDTLEIANKQAIPYLHFFRELVQNFGKKGQLGCFINWWKKEGEKQQIPIKTEEKAIQVMTIHQAKGLAFDVVIIPFCAWPLDHPPHHPPVLWGHSSLPPFNKLIKAPLYYSQQLLDTHYDMIYYREKIQTYLDHINLLYVATTRPRKQLFIFAPQGGPHLSTLGDLMHKAFFQNEGPLQKLNWQKKTESDADIFSLGTMCVRAQEFHTRKQDSTINTSPVHTPIPHEKILDNLRIDHEEQGVWWHQLLAEVEKSEDIERVLQERLAHQEITSEEMNMILETVSKWWTHNLLATWFDGSWQVKREQSILLPGGKILRPDRVMIRGNEAVVLDFKTGKASTEHGEQVKAYAAILKDMGYTPVSAYLFYTTENCLNCIV